MKATLAEKKAEILAPAGCYASLQAAIDAGADAVYFGLAQLKVDNNYVFSPNDIATIEFLDQVLAAGVHTMKIEGRGRSPEYVKLVTRAYRKAVDAIREDRYTNDFVDQVLGELKKVYNRRHSSGYYLGRPQGWSAAYGSKATHQKVLGGEVSHYYPKIGVAEIRALREIAAGSDFLIIGKSSGVVEGCIEEMHLDDGPVDQARRGDCFSIRVPQRVRPKDKFYISEPVAAGTESN